MNATVIDSRFKMALKRKPRKLEVYSLHCRNEDSPVDYMAAFKQIADAPLDARQFEQADRKVVIPTISIVEDVVELIAYEGPPGVNPLIFDAGTGAERYEALHGDQILATRTHAIIDLTAKEGIIEYNQRGAKAFDLAFVLEEAATQIGLGEKFTVELIAAADKSFLDALERFGRIKVASVKVAQPNFDWDDNYQTMNLIGRESHARNVELIAVANRNDSLARDNGVVHYIRQMVARQINNLKAATVEGVRAGETAETRISLANFVQHQKIYARVDQHGHIVGEDIQAHLRSFLETRRRSRNTE